jgi:ketosteroid isomerase-like protein
MEWRRHRRPLCAPRPGCCLRYIALRDWPEPEYVGHVGFRRFLTEWLEVWDAFEVGVDQLVAAPDGRVVSLFWQRGQGRKSGLGMDVKWALISMIRDDKVLRIELYESGQQALEAVGLPG